MSQVKRIKEINVFVFLVVLMNNVGFAQDLKDSIQMDAFLHVFDKQLFEMSYVKDFVPKKVNRILNRKTQFGLDMVNPGEPYNTSSVISKKFPHAQLVFGGLSSDNYGYVYFRYGKTEKRRVLLFHKGRIKVTYYLIHLDSFVETEGHLLEEIRLRKFYVAELI